MGLDKKTVGMGSQSGWDFMNLFIEMWPCPHKIRCHHYKCGLLCCTGCYLTAIRVIQNWFHRSLTKIEKLLKFQREKSTGPA